jgi:aspartate/glutamate racemase/prolyl-tRNA editing enzyme YbaK/EbsC (Cys-tRNA(Pro) deacylase)
MIVAVGPETPEVVQENVRFLQSHGVWHLVSNNPRVDSCAAAADKRWRLGGRGIPLCDELKSSIGYVGYESNRRYVVVHCRGHQRLDNAKLAAVLGGPFTRLSDESLARFGMAYGLVTPFGFAEHPDILQVFDRCVLERYFPPYTMMTNLGALTYGVEFNCQELVAALPTTQIADVVRDSDSTIPRDRTFGILTGNSPESGMLLWGMINDYIRAHNSRSFRGDVAFPRVVVESVPEMGLSMELALRADDVRPIVLGAVERLCQAGANVVGIACNTTQFFSPEVSTVCASHGARFISLVDATTEHLKQEGIHRFDFFGISAVTDFGGWSDFTRLALEFELLRPGVREIETITRVAFSVKQRGIDGRSVNRLRDLVNDASRTDTVVIALTELSWILKRHPQRKGDKELVDTLQVLAAAMADTYLLERVAVTTPKHRDNDPQ